MNLWPGSSYIFYVWSLNKLVISARGNFSSNRKSKVNFSYQKKPDRPWSNTFQEKNYISNIILKKSFEIYRGSQIRLFWLLLWEYRLWFCSSRSSIEWGTGKSGAVKWEPVSFLRRENLICLVIFYYLYFNERRSALNSTTPFQANSSR